MSYSQCSKRAGEKRGDSGGTTPTTEGSKARRTQKIFDAEDESRQSEMPDDVLKKVFRYDMDDSTMDEEIMRRKKIPRQKKKLHPSPSVSLSHRGGMEVDQQNSSNRLHEKET